MIKSELITKLAMKQQHLSEQDIALCVNTLIDKMMEHLADNGRIEIRDFGSFALHYRPPRLAHNPRTGEKLTTDAKYAVHFKPGKAMKERINESRHLPIKEARDEDE
ncbi:MAG: integration host factor subunit beta [Pseudomonadota bacterium]